ncbi:ribosome maturation factor RimM, partial [Nocardia sp. NPDC058497]
MELVVGRVAKSHGVRGELVVEVRTDEPELRFAPGATLHGRMPKSAATRDYTVKSAPPHAGPARGLGAGRDLRTPPPAPRGQRLVGG